MLGKLIIAALGLYVLVGLGFRQLEHRILFHPTERVLSGCDLNQNVTLIEFRGERALLTRTGADRLVVFYHGNGGDICNWRYLGPNHLAPLGYDTLVVEYPGYGGDPRQPGKQTLLVAARAAHDWASARYKHVSVMGYSMGSAPAAHHAGLGGVEALLLFAPFDTMYGLLRPKGYWYPRALLSNDFDNVAALSGGAPPTVIVHGARDRLIPPERGQALADAIGARFILREDRGHAGLMGDDRFDALLREVFGQN